eukprot:7135998-Prymnesium_polylepis.2
MSLRGRLSNPNHAVRVGQLAREPGEGARRLLAPPHIRHGAAEPLGELGVHRAKGGARQLVRDREELGSEISAVRTTRIRQASCRIAKTGGQCSGVRSEAHVLQRRAQGELQLLREEAEQRAARPRCRPIAEPANVHPRADELTHGARPASSSVVADQARRVARARTHVLANVPARSGRGLSCCETGREMMREQPGTAAARLALRQARPAALPKERPGRERSQWPRL